MSREHVTSFPVGYLPIDCPACGRLRLEYGTNEAGHVVYVECEKCGASSDGELFDDRPPGRDSDMTNFSLQPSHVRCEVFRKNDDSSIGKWLEGLELDMSGLYDGNLLETAIKEALIRSLGRTYGTMRLGGMWAVVFDPCHVHAHPMAIEIPLYV